jgi:hypothetical protein
MRFLLSLVTAINRGVNERVALLLHSISSPNAYRYKRLSAASSQIMGMMTWS